MAPHFPRPILATGNVRVSLVTQFNTRPRSYIPRARGLPCCFWPFRVGNLSILESGNGFHWLWGFGEGPWSYWPMSLPLFEVCWSRRRECEGNWGRDGYGVCVCDEWPNTGNTEIHQVSQISQPQESLCVSLCYPSHPIPSHPSHPSHQQRNMSDKRLTHHERRCQCRAMNELLFASITTKFHLGPASFFPNPVQAQRAIPDEIFPFLSHHTHPHPAIANAPNASQPSDICPARSSLPEAATQALKALKVC